MMGIYIADMKMPTECLSCLFCNDNWDCVLQEQDYRDWESQKANCPLIEVKEPHGRLIDEDTISYRCDILVRDCATSDFVDGIIYANECVLKTPTVIEAEGE